MKGGLFPIRKQSPSFICYKIAFLKTFTILGFSTPDSETPPH